MTPPGNVGVVSNEVELALLPVLPNPSNGACVIRCVLTRAGHVRLSILDLKGRAVKILANGDYGAGTHPITWDGGTLSGRAPSGVYFARLETPSKTLGRTLVLLR